MSLLQRSGPFGARSSAPSSPSQRVVGPVIGSTLSRAASLTLLTKTPQPTTDGHLLLMDVATASVKPLVMPPSAKKFRALHPPHSTSADSRTFAEVTAGASSAASTGTTRTVPVKAGSRPNVNKPSLMIDNAVIFPVPLISTSEERHKGVLISSLPNVPLEEYLVALASITTAKNITYASRIAKSIQVHFSNRSWADECAMKGIDLHGRHLDVKHLSITPIKVTISNVPPEVPHQYIRQQLNRFGRVVGQIRNIKAGLKHPDFQHIFSFRRSALVEFADPEDVHQIPKVVHATFGGHQYTFYTSVGVMCFACHDCGHIRRNCPNRPRSSPPAFSDATSPVPGAAAMDTTVPVSVVPPVLFPAGASAPTFDVAHDGPSSLPPGPGVAVDGPLLHTSSSSVDLTASSVAFPPVVSDHSDPIAASVSVSDTFSQVLPDCLGDSEATLTGDEGVLPMDCSPTSRFSTKRSRVSPARPSIVRVSRPLPVPSTVVVSPPTTPEGLFKRPKGVDISLFSFDLNDLDRSGERITDIPETSGVLSTTELQDFLLQAWRHNDDFVNVTGFTTDFSNLAVQLNCVADSLGAHYPKARDYVRDLSSRVLRQVSLDEV